MRRCYTVPFQGTVTAAGGDTELFYLKPAADKPIRIRGFRLGQFSEFGDAQEENIRISIIYLPATVTASTLGTAVTPVDTDTTSNSTAGFTARCNDTAVATTSGTARILEEMAWNIRSSPFEFRWMDEDEIPKAGNPAALVVRMQSTLADDVSMAITAWVDEF